MICGPAIPPSATCWSGCAKAVPNSPAGGRPTTSAASRQDEKSLIHPKKGRLKLEYASFQANDDPALKLVIYTTV